MPEVQDNTERILYRLSLDPKARALAEKLLGRSRCLVGNLPASADHHHSEPGGLYSHSVEVALGTLEPFEGNITMERKPDGSVDSFRSSRNRPRWQYAIFIAALCHDLGKLFDLELKVEERRWYPLKQTYAEFVRVDRKPLTVTWKADRQHGAHALLSCFLIHHLLSPEDADYLGLPRLICEVAAWLKLHPKTVSQMARERRISAITLPLGSKRKQFRFVKGAVGKWLSSAVVSSLTLVVPSQRGAK